MADVFSTAADVFGAAAKGGLKYDYVEVPELGEGAVIRVRELTGYEREEFDKSVATVSGTPGNSRGRRRKGRKRKKGESLETHIEYHAHKSRVLVVGLACVNEAGEQLFPNREDKVQVGGMSFVVLDRLFKKIMVLSEMAEDEEEEDEEGGEDFDGDEDEDEVEDGVRDPIEVAQEKS